MDPPMAKRMKLMLASGFEEHFFGIHQQTVSSPTVMGLIHSWRKKQSVKTLKYTALLEDDDHFRSQLYFESWLPRYLQYDFFLLFRLERNTFHCLLNVFGHYINEKQYCGGHFPIALEKSLLISVAYLARKETILMLSDRFNVACSTIHACITHFLEIMTKSLMRKFISWPSSRIAEETERKFRQICGFPGIIGAIDGCHIKAKVPVIQQDSYQDRKSQHSISIQAICSSEKLFYNISAGFPGSLHDARILKESTLYRNIIQYGEEKYFYGKYHLVGDSAYPCKHWLMCPYRDNGHLRPEQRLYNILLSKSRVRIENSFALLKGRWRILRDIDTYSIERAVGIIIACCVLHNYCLLNGDHFQIEDNENQGRRIFEGEDDARGMDKRREITNLLWQNRHS